MKYTLILTHQALLDEMEAYHYYENILPGLGERFLESLENRYVALSKHPEHYSFSDSKKIIRDVAIDGFPYLIIYEIIDSRVIVFAVHNTYSKPLSE